MNLSRDKHLRVALKDLYRAALAGVDPKRSTANALMPRAVRGFLASGRRLGIFAVGKAAAGMLEGAPRADRTLVILPKGYPPPRRRKVEALFAAHPFPDISSLRAARRAIAFFGSFSEEDVILCLLSGGASSLLCLPRPGITLAQKRAAVARAMASGASIVEINRRRTRLSAVKGGKLGRATRARLATLVLSDVPGDDPALVGSGPTIRNGRRSRGRRGDFVAVVASNSAGLLAAVERARGRGMKPRVVARRLEGEAREAGRRFARAARQLAPGAVLLAGGETTVTLSTRPGKGGRNLELALAAAIELDGHPEIALLAAGSDGIDGSSRAAGAFADGTTLERARDRGLDLDEALRRHDTEPFFAELEDLFVTGPTGTNVCDWVFAIRFARVRREA
jgi:glycerate 2-kinase